MPGLGKKYYRIGEVSRITGFEPHVLRYWESEFPQIKPRRVARQRLFRKKDVELISRIRDLLQEEGFTISGARKQLLKELRGRAQAASPQADRQKKGEDNVLAQVRSELAEIERLLDKF